LTRPIQIRKTSKKGDVRMLSDTRKHDSVSLEPVGGQTSAKHAAETRLLVELKQLDWLHAPSGIERLEAVVGRERLSQLLLLVALWPEDEDLFGRSLPATQAA